MITKDIEFSSTKVSVGLGLALSLWERNKAIPRLRHMWLRKLGGIWFFEFYPQIPRI